MTQDLMQVSNTLPAYLQNQKLTYKDSGLGAGIAARAPKLGLSSDKRFTLTKDGSTTFLTDKVRVVLVASASTLTKAWYAKGWTPGSTDAPDCFSLDAKVPAPGCSQPQSTNCATCKKNAFGSHPATGRGKACGDRKMVVLVWDGEPATLMTMNFPTTSLSALKEFDTKMRGSNYPLQSVLVEMSFDPMFSHPRVKLNPVGFVDESTATRLMEAAGSQEVAELLRETDEVEYSPGDTPAEPKPVVPDTVVQFGAPLTVEMVDTPPVSIEVGLPKTRKSRTVKSEPVEAAPAPEVEEEATPLIDPDTGSALKPAGAPATTGGFDVMAAINAWKSK